MEEKTIVYNIYHDTAMTDMLVKKLNKMNKRVNKLNTSLAALTLLTVASFAAMCIRYGLQREKIKEMSENIEELKKAKGE